MFSLLLQPDLLPELQQQLSQVLNDVFQAADGVRSGLHTWLLGCDQQYCCAESTCGQIAQQMVPCFSRLAAAIEWYDLQKVLDRAMHHELDMSGALPRQLQNLQRAGSAHACMDSFTSLFGP